jgi:hypothetical protein
MTDGVQNLKSVRIHNLSGRPELNDYICKIVSYEKAKG